MTTAKPSNAELMKQHRAETKALLSRISQLTEDIHPKSQSRRLGKSTLKLAIGVLESLQQKDDVKESELKKPDPPANKRPVPRLIAPIPKKAIPTKIVNTKK